MHFCSLAYLLFFSGVFVVYWMLPWTRARVWLLLAASFGFYATWNLWLTGLIAFSTSIDYWLARGIDDTASPKIRKLLLTTSIVGNLSLLAYFKYVNFFLTSLQSLLAAVGMEYSIPLFSVILPIGISFYTFEAINYMVDVYRRKLPAERNLANFMLFITFFPHLVAGPIVRARGFLVQIQRPKRWNWARMHLGVQLILMGLFKKLAIADRMACMADPLFANPESYPADTLWLGLLASALQIYGDFSGYSDMAVGFAHLLGYRLARNFNMPFLATNIADFWRRWHISLSTWLRDYVFNSLRCGSRWMTYRNLLITMTLGGLWHGANWTFVIFGAVHGLLLVVHRMFRDWTRSWPVIDRCLGSHLGTVGRVLFTFLVCCLTMVVFRAATLERAGAYFRGLLSFGASAYSSPMHHPGVIWTFLVVAVCHLVALSGWHRRHLIRLPAPVLGFSYAAVATLTLILIPASGKAFIYFQF